MKIDLSMFVEKINHNACIPRMRTCVHACMHRELLSESTKMTWEKIKPVVEDARKQLTQGKSGEYIPVYQSWEYLYNEMKKREQQLSTIQ